MFETIRSVVPPIHREGFIFVFIFLIVTLLLMLLSPLLGMVGIIATVWCYYFFRDPNRMVPQKSGLVVSPGDGVVCDIAETLIPEEAGGDGTEKRIRISIFLNVFNVHVNRVPIAGRITHLYYRAGKFFNASLDKASSDNEAQFCKVETEEGEEVIFVQIAGLVARRILCELKEDATVETGERFGLIRFGSRCDVYLPKGIKPKVTIGQTMIGGETVLASLKTNKAGLSYKEL